MEGVQSDQVDAGVERAFDRRGEIRNHLLKPSYYLNEEECQERKGHEAVVQVGHIF